MDDYMSTEPEQVENDESASIEAGFQSVQGGAYSTSDDHTPDEPEATDEVETEDEPEPEPEEQVFAGFTEAQLKQILERATRVDSIEDQLRKAHGKIGELHGKMQEFQQSRTTQQAPSADFDDSDLSEFESTFPEFAPAVEARARKIAQEVMQSHLEQLKPGEPADPDAVNKAVNLAVMDATSDGWRDTVSSSDFSLWLATQPEAVQTTYQTTWNAKELGAIVKSYDGWKQSSSSRSAKSKQRLEAGLVPDGKSSKVTHAISETDAMQAGFEAVRNPRYYNTR